MGYLRFMYLAQCVRIRIRVAGTSYSVSAPTSRATPKLTDEEEELEAGRIMITIRV